MNDLVLKVTELSASGTVTVEMSNSSREPIKIWKDSNSWGASRWRVLRVRKGQVETFFQNPDKDFTRNVPSFHEIAAGAHIEQKLDLNDGNWRVVRGEDHSLKRGDLIIVVYDVPFTPESLKFGVWYGVSTAFAPLQ